MPVASRNKVSTWSKRYFVGSAASTSLHTLSVINYCQWLHPFCVWILPCIFRCFVDESNLPPRKQSFSTLGFLEALNASPKSLWRKIFSHLFYDFEIYMQSLTCHERGCACAGQCDVVHTNQLKIVIIHCDDAWGSEAAATSSSKEMINMRSSHNDTTFPISRHHT